LSKINLIQKISDTESICLPNVVGTCKKLKKNLSLVNNNIYEIFKKSILIPSYKNHVKYVEKLLYSLNKNLVDDTINVYVIISHNEYDIFNYLLNINDINKINLKILFFNKIIKSILNINVHEDILLGNYDTHTF
jgi:cellulose synthase/poly-beta-1,6-N-acetylglucosamine synthase-like glycosyltransferase